MAVNLSALPDISFAPQSAAEVEARIITTHEKLRNVTLQPGDPERLFLESLAYYISVQNGVIDKTGKQNLLAYATGASLDHLGALMGVARIPAQPARCILRFSLATALNWDAPVPEGTRVATLDGKIAFATQVTAVIPAGGLFCECLGICTEPGAAASGLLPGQICRLADPLPWIGQAVNITQSEEGADVEDDERLRERIRLAPESFTVAGSAGEYEARALAVSSDIASVSVTTPKPGVVDVRFVLAGGALPDAATIELVADALSGETVRPLTDMVLVGAPDQVSYDLKAVWYARRKDSSMLGQISACVEQALAGYISWQHEKPGRDIVPDRLASLVYQAGAKRIEIETPAFTRILATEIAVEREVALQFGGLEEE